MRQVPLAVRQAAVDTMPRNAAKIDGSATHALRLPLRTLPGPLYLAARRVTEGCLQRRSSCRFLLFFYSESSHP